MSPTGSDVWTLNGHLVLEVVEHMRNSAYPVELGY